MNDLGKALLFYANHPAEFVEDVIRAKPDPAQRHILESVAHNKLTSVRSGHGVGKSAVEAWAVIWFICTRPYPKIPCTAPTQHQLFDILWAEISKWIRNNPLLSSELIWTKEKVYMRGHPEEWFAVARTASKPDALQGFHAQDLFFIIDEASGVDDKIFEPVLGALSTPGARLLMCGNPTNLSGFFYDSHHKNRPMYHTIHIDGRDSSRVDREFIDSIINMFGEDSDVFRVRVAGDFPKALPDSFIPMEWAERASGKVTIPENPKRIDIGVDVARYGDDSSVVCPVYDKTQQGEPDIYHHNNITELAGHVVILVKRLARKYAGAEIHVKIDCDGLGVGVYDIVQEQTETIIGEVIKPKTAIKGGKIEMSARRRKRTGPPRTAAKSMKMGEDELKEIIKSAVKEAMGEGEEKEDEEAPLEGVTAGDILAVVEQAMDAADEKRKARKDEGEEVAAILSDMVPAGEKEDDDTDGEEKDEGVDNEEKEDGSEDEEKEDGEDDEAKRRKSAPARRRHTKSAAAPGQRKYSSLFLGGSGMKPKNQKKVPPMVQLARAIPLETGNLNIPRMTSGTRAMWGGEARKIQSAQPTFGNLRLSAKRLEAIVPQTRELIMSTKYSADEMFANDLARRMQLGLDWGGLYGTGGEFQPTGIANTKGVEIIDAGKLDAQYADKDGRLTADFPVYIKSLVLSKNVDDQSLGWAFNSFTEGYLMNLKTTTGDYLYRDEMNGGRFLGIPYATTNQIPTKDGKTDIFFGNWADLMIGDQMGMETFTTMEGSWTDENGVIHNAFEENLVGTRALMYDDIGVRHVESFVYVKNVRVI